MTRSHTGLKITNNFLHDMGTGTWFACVIVTLALRPHLAGAGSVASTALLEALRDVFALAILSLATITVTGAFRLVYWRAATPQAERATKRRLLIIKHVGFLLLYGGGTVWLYLQTIA